MKTLFQPTRRPFRQISAVLVTILVISPLMSTLSSGQEALAQVVTPDVTLTFDASFTEIEIGESSTLTWAATDAVSCTASGGWTGVQPGSGTLEVTPAVNTTYLLTCVNDVSIITRSVTVLVVPTIRLSASDLAVPAGTPVALNWAVTQADTCTASGGWSGVRALSGVETVFPTLTTTYTLTCTGAGGTSVQEITIGVPPSLEFFLTSLYLPEELLAIDILPALSWSSPHADMCIASDGWEGSVGSSGSQEVFPQRTTTYTLTCSNVGGSVVRSVTLTVESLCFDLTWYAVTSWYTILMAQSLDKRNETVLCMPPGVMLTLVNTLTTTQLYTLLSSLSIEARGHLIVGMTDAQLSLLVSGITCMQLYTLLTTSGTAAEVRLLNVMNSEQLVSLLSCITSAQLKLLLIGNGTTLEPLPCNLQAVLISALTQDQLDTFLLDISASEAELNLLLTGVCAEEALYMLENASEDTQSSIVPLISIATVGILLYALSSTGQATLATVVGGATVASALSTVLRPHGGRAIVTTPCTCMPGSFLINIGFLSNPTIIGPRMWVAGVTRQYAVGNIWPSAWQMGLSTGNLGCYMYTGNSCVPRGFGPIMLKNGTSAY